MSDDDFRDELDDESEKRAVWIAELSRDELNAIGNGETVRFAFDGAVIENGLAIDVELDPDAR